MYKINKPGTMLFTDIRDLLTKKCRRMAFESVLHSHGLSEEQHSHVLQLRNDELLTLEHLALEKLVNAIAKGQFGEAHLLCLPTPLYSPIVHKLVCQGIACPNLMLKLLKRSVRYLNLTDNTQSCILYSASVLHKLREVSLECLILDNNSSLTDGLLAHLKDIKSLTILSLAGCRSLSNDLFRHVKELKNLKSLSVSRICKVSTAGVSQLYTGGDSLLEHLDLSYTSVEEAEPHNIFRALMLHSNLHSLNLSGTSKICNLSDLSALQGLKNLIICKNTLSTHAIESELGQLKTVEYLDLDGTEIHSSHSSLQCILDLPLLRYLNLNIKVISETFQQRILPQLESINLTTISLANNSWLNDLMLIRLLDPLPGLMELDISHTRVTSRCLKEELPQLNKLTILGLQGVELNDDDMAFLTSIPELRKLNISDTLLTDTFITKEYLTACRHLELLSLCRTHISDRGLEYLRLSQLRTLWLDGCSVSVEAVLSLSTARCRNLSYVSLRESKPIRDEEEILAAEVLDMLD